MCGPSARLLGLALLVALCACPGNLPDKDGPLPSGHDWVPWPGREGTITKTGDGKRLVDGQRPPDSKAWKPDKTPWPKTDLSPKVDTKGTSLPDKPGGIVPCTPAGGCNVDSACAPTEICIVVSGTSNYVCKPATSTAGGACNATLWCPNHTVCVGFSGTGDGTCRTQCPAAGQPCGSGGTCVAYQACLYCSK